MIKLPSLSNTANMRKSVSFTTTTERNTRNQLTLITQKLDDMQSEIHNARMDANVIYFYIFIGNFEPYEIFKAGVS